MESINECFLLEKELRGVVQKGMRGNVGAVEYLEEVGWATLTLFERREIGVRIRRFSALTVPNIAQEKVVGALCTWSQTRDVRTP